MTISKWIIMGVAATSALALVGCSKKPYNSYTEQPRMVKHGGANAKTYALGQQNNFKTARFSFHKNAMSAPTNQTYYFTFNSSKLKPKSHQALNIQANYLASHPNAKVRLQGNTDSRGSRKYNYGLGLRRDQAVARYLEQRGVSANQIDMISYGKERPAVTATAMGRQNIQTVWALNRRVNVIYTNKG